MPTQTKFLITSGVALVDLSGVFEPLDGGTSYTSAATKYRVGTTDLTGIFHASTSVDDRIANNTNYKITVNGSAVDLKTIFRRYGYSGLSITVQPASETKAEGESVTFSITATTTSGTLSYLWKKNGVNVGTNSPSYTINPIAIGDDGASIVCVVSNGTSSLTSSAAILTVHYVTITSNPVAGSFNELDDPTISVAATVKPAPASYQWQFSSNNVSFTNRVGATNASLTFTDILRSEEYYYRCLIRNSGNTVEKPSQSALIQVYYQNTIQTQPTDQGVIINGSNDATFSIVAVGKTTPTYKWQFRSSSAGTFADINASTQGGRAIGYLTSSLVISNAVQEDNGYQYQCIVSNNKAAGDAWNNTTSSVATLNAYYINITQVVVDEDGAQTAVTSNQQQFDVDQLDVVKLFITASGNPNILSYQWKKWNGSSYQNVNNGGNISGATSSTLQFSGIGTADEAYYACFVTNAQGASADTVNSREVFLNVIPIPAPVITDLNPDAGNANYNDGDAPTLSVTATGYGTLSYQWRKNGTPIGGATQSQYTIPAIGTGANNTADGSQFTVAVTNVGGTTISSAIVIVRYFQNSITTQPQPEIVNSGETATFSIAATGRSTPAYQWQEFNGSSWVNITNATQASYDINNTSPSDDGRLFRCIVSNNKAGGDAWNNTTSSQVSLTVNYAPSNQSISGQEIYNHNQNNTVAFTASVTLGKPTSTTYTWQKSTNGGVSWTQVRQVTTTNASDEYSFANATNTDAGNKYRCVISNSVGSVTTAQKTVYINPNITVEPLNRTTNEGSTATFSITASGSPNLTYTWYKVGQGTAVQTGSSNQYTTPVTTATNNGDQYYCVVSSSISGTTSDTSGSATLTVVYLNEQVWLPGWDNGLTVTYTAGDLAGLKTITTNDNQSSTYVWEKWNGSAWVAQNTSRGANLLPGQNADELTWASIDSSDAGTYRCRVSNSYTGSPIYTQNFTVTVN